MNANANNAAARLRAALDRHAGWHIHEDIRLVVDDRAELIAQRDKAVRALEDLHARIHRDLPSDGSEVPQPDDEYWARTLDDLVQFADSVYLPVADGAS